MSYRAVHSLLGVLLLILFAGCSQKIDPALLPLIVQQTVDARPPVVVEQTVVAPMTVEVTREIEVIQLLEQEVAVTRIVVATPTAESAAVAAAAPAQTAAPTQTPPPAGPTPTLSTAELLQIVIRQTRDQILAFHEVVDRGMDGVQIDCGDIFNRYTAVSQRAVFDVAGESEAVQIAHDEYRLAVVRFVQTNRPLVEGCQAASPTPATGETGNTGETAADGPPPGSPLTVEAWEESRRFRPEVLGYLETALASFDP